MRAPNPTIFSAALSSLALSITATPASATWSILIADTRTGEIAIGSATCLTSIDLAIETPVVLTGIGAITAQSSIDQGGLNRMFIRDRLLDGQPLASILTELESFDPGHNNRQYGMITTTGQTLTYSGIDNADWAGGITGRIEQGRPGPDDDIVYAVQGNTLTGKPVVQAAVDAIINTDSDLPGKLMAAMLAARTTGGDGRCSCSNANPTACGSPPPGDFKSAHVGYMIGSRADDTDAIRAFYDLGSVSTGLTTLDLNNDSIPDYATSTQDGTIELYLNATRTTDQVSHFNFLSSIDTKLPGLSKLTAADLDNNGHQDLITLTTPTTIAILLQTKPGTFDPPILVPFADPITDIEPINVQSIPSQQLILTIPSRGSFSVVNFDGTTLQTIETRITEGGNQAAAATDLNNDSIEDILIVDTQGEEIRHFYLDQDGNSTSSLSVYTSPNPAQVRVADINNDTLPDILAATTTSRMIDAFINTGTLSDPEYAPIVSSPINGNIIDFNIADMNNDGIQDIVALTTDTRNIQILAGDNTGSFKQIYRGRLQGGPTTALVADLNDDGDLDIITQATDKLLILDNINPGTVPGPNGFAFGLKYLNINIRNQNASDEDPVDQMLTQFNDFRAAHTGLPDAVQTTVSAPSRIVIDKDSPSYNILIELRDWNQTPILSPATFTLEFNPSNLTPGLPQLVKPGTYSIPITALTDNNATPGNHPLKIKATAAETTVTLMPTITIATTNSLADFNADGQHDFIDISLFLTAFTAQSPTADLNHDTQFDFLDISLFINAFTTTP